MKQTLVANMPQKRRQNSYNIIWPLILILWPHQHHACLHWVKSHQDKKKPFERFSVCAKINIAATDQATKGQEDLTNLPVHLTENSPTQLMINGLPVTKCQRRAILAKTYRVERKASILRTSGVLVGPDRQWNTMGQTTSALLHPKQLTISRLITNNLSTGKHLLLPLQTSSPICATCDNSVTETTEHIIYCPVHAEWRQKTLEK